MTYLVVRSLGGSTRLIAAEYLTLSNIIRGPAPDHERCSCACIFCPSEPKGICMRPRGHRESGRCFHVCQRCADGARARGDARHSGRSNTGIFGGCNIVFYAIQPSTVAGVD